MKTSRIKKRAKIEFYLNLALATSAIIISILGLTNLTKNVITPDKVPYIILALVGLLITNSTLERRNRLNAIENKLDDMKSLITESNIDKLQHTTDDISPDLKDIFKDYIDDFIEFFKDAINNQTIKFYDIERFKTSYINTLEFKKNEKSTFLATSLPYKRYFWTNNEELTPMLKSIKDFVAVGGSFKRIFFYKEEDLLNEETIAILDRQLEFCVDVILINREKIPRRLNRYFVVDDNATLAWEVQINAEQVINSMAFTTSKKELLKYKSIFQELMNLDDKINYETEREAIKKRLEEHSKNNKTLLTS